MTNSFLGFSPWLALINFVPALIALAYVIARRGTYDPFEPASFVFLPYAVIPMFAGLHILLRSNEPMALMPIALEHVTSSAYALSGLIHIAALSLFLVGYSARMKPIKIQRISTFKKTWSTKRTYFFVGILLLVSSYTTLEFIKLFGIDTLALNTISKRRFLDVGDGLNSAALGYSTWLSDFGRYAFMALAAYYICSSKRMNAFRLALLLCAFLVAAAPLVIKSARIELFFLILGAAVIYHYGRRKISFLNLGLIAMVGIVVLTVMGSLRSSERSSDYEFAPKSIVEEVGTREGVGYSLLARVITDMPGVWNFQLGRTYSAWIYAPVPRSLWPEKPAISLGQEVKVELFGRAHGGGGGIPPKSVGELFINFGYFGVLLLVPWFLAAGIVSKMVYRTFSRWKSPGPFVLFAYAVVLIEVIPGIFLGQFSASMVRSIQIFTTLLFLKWAFGIKIRHSMNSDGSLRGVAGNAVKSAGAQD